MIHPALFALSVSLNVLLAQMEPAVLLVELTETLHPHVNVMMGITIMLELVQTVLTNAQHVAVALLALHVAILTEFYYSHVVVLMVTLTMGLVSVHSVQVNVIHVVIPIHV